MKGKKTSGVRKPWHAPRLSSFGLVRELTAGGTLEANKEKDGKFKMGMMGDPDEWQRGTFKP